MPLISENGEKVTVGNAVSVVSRPTAGPTAPSAVDTLGAAFRLENTVGSAFASKRRVTTHNSFGDLGLGELTEQAIGEDNYSPFDPDETGTLPIEGYVRHAERFVRAGSPVETEQLKRQIDREEKDRETLRAAGGWGYAASFAAGMLDPLVLVPVGGQIKFGTGIVKTGLKAARAGAVSAAVTEAALHATQETRTKEESMIAIGGATFLSGIMGAGIKALSKGERARLAKVLDDELLDPLAADFQESSVGAKRTRDTSIDEETLVGAFGAEKGLKQLNPLLRLSQSPSVEVRRTLQDIADVPLELEKHRKGIATAQSAEGEVRKWDAPLGSFIGDLDRLYVEYRTGATGGRAKRNAIGLKDAVGTPFGRGRPKSLMSFAEFRQAAGQAARRKDEHPIPQVAEASRLLRRTLTDPLKDEAIHAKLLPEDIEVSTADSYFPRLYDVPKINAERPEFRAIIVRDLLKQQQEQAVKLDRRRGDLGFSLRAAMREENEKAVKQVQTKIDGLHDQEIFVGLELQELEDMAEQIINHIVGTPAGRTPNPSVTLHRGPLKERVFQISDYDIEEYLIDDIASVASAHVRTVAPDVALAKRFGPEVDAPYDKVIDEYDNLIRAAKDDKERNRLAKLRENDLRDLAALRDRLRGVYRMPDDPTHWAVRGGRVLRTWNFLRMLGGVTLSSFTDVARPVMTEGLWRTLKSGLVPMVTGFKAIKLSGAEARLAGTAWDLALDTRALNLAELGSDFSIYSTLDKTMGSMSSGFSIASLISPWTAFAKDVSSTIIGTRILETATSWAATGKLSKAYVSKLAQSGIDQEGARQIAAMFKKHGTKHRGALLPNTEKWENIYAADLYRAALSRDIDRTIITPGIADRPLWMSTEAGKMIGQFRTFAFAATNRMMIAGLQQSDMAVLNGALLSVAIGAGIYGLKSRVAGIETSDDPKVWLNEGLDRAGLFGILMDVNNVSEKATGGKIGLSAFTGTEGMSRYALRNDIGALLGPSMGTVKDALTVAKLAAGGELKRSDVRAARRLMPFQNLFYIRWLLTHLQDEAADQLEAKGR